MRDAIAESLDATLFIEAGAGSGKTRGLVERIGALLLSGRARIDEIAAITFTEAAAAELRDRIAAMLEEAAARGAGGAPPTQLQGGAGRSSPATADAAGDDAPSRARQALEGLDAAAITTLHGFCRRILAEHPFEAGLPPVFDVCDEARSAVDFAERWAAILDALLEDPVDARAVQWVLVCGGSLDGLRAMARALGDNWDLLGRGGRPPDLPPLDVGPVREPLVAAIGLAGACSTPEDRLLGHLRSLVPYADRLGQAAEEGELAVLDVLAGRQGKLSAGNRGRVDQWDGRKPEVSGLLAEAEAARTALLEQAVRAALGRLCARTAVHVLEAAGARRREGRLEYHDLLVLARDLVRDRPAVREALHDQYRYLLIDEYQDTDPIQAELALRIAAGSGAPAGAAAPDPWALPIEPGRLFFVGDPHQSIYAFRRADVELFHRTKGLVAGTEARLTTNFRSVPGVVAWVDAVFGRLIGEGGGPLAYVGSHPYRPAADGGRAPVVVIGPGRPPARSAEEARQREATDVAAAARAAVAEQWPVGEERRPARLSDVTVLIPTRRSLAALQAAFESAGVPYRLESSSLVFASAEVQDLTTTLRAIDDPTDECAVVATLRSAGFGCGDDDLFRYRSAGGTWDYRAEVPAGWPAGEAVAAGLAWLHDLHRARTWLDVSALVGRVIEDRRLLLLALDDERWRDAWRRLRFVADLARRFTESVGGDLRRFLAWLDVQAAEDAGVTEVVLPEADQDAVRVMTIHAAKGLEFPVVVVAGLGGQRPSRPPAVLFGPAGPEVGLRRDLCTAGYPDLAAGHAAVDDAERLRLLYVAVTRAQDHLVVSCHRAEKAADSLAARLEAALESVDGAIEWARWSAADGAPSALAASPPLSGPGFVPVLGHGPRGIEADGLARRGAWLAERERRLSAPPGTVPATRLASVAAAAGALESPEPYEEGGGKPGWRRGRAGTAVGRAVHAVLQVVDLAAGDGLDDLAAAYAEAEGIPARSGEIATLARTALASDVVRAAARHGRYWRELYVGVPVGPRVLEGYVDLLVDGPDGLEVVDYKTDQVGEDADVGAASARYRLQGAAYALAVEAAVGRPVVRCTFLFLRPGGALAQPVADLTAATADVRRLLDPSPAGPGRRGEAR